MRKEAQSKSDGMQWQVAHISNVNAIGKVNGASVRCTWYRLGLPVKKPGRKSPEFILCNAHDQMERAGKHFQFVKPQEAPE